MDKLDAFKKIDAANPYYQEGITKPAFFKELGSRRRR